MPTFFSSSFRKARGSSPESLAIKNATLYLAKKRAENDAGVINDPATYTEAIDKFLRPYEDDVAVATKIAQLQAESNQLSEKVNNEELKKAVFNSDLEDAMYEIGRKNYNDPGTVILKTAAVYDQYLTEIEAEIDQRMRNNQSYSTLLQLKREVEPKVTELASLTRSYMAGEDREKATAPRGNFGFYIKTNPETGKIINFSLQPIDQNSGTQKGFIKTDSFYGQVPVYLNGVRDQANDNKFTAKLGNSVYTGEVEENQLPEQSSPTKQTILKLQNKKDIDLGFGQSIANIFRVGDRQKKFDIKQGAYDISLPQDSFDRFINMPRNSVGRDSTGNYYFLNNDGKWFKAPNAELLSQMTGMQPAELNSQAYFLSKPDLEAIGNFQEPNGQSRILNERNTFTPQVQNNPGQVGTSSPQSTLGPQPVSTPEPKAAATPAPAYDSKTTPTSILQVKGAAKQAKNTKAITMANVINTNA